MRDKERRRRRTKEAVFAFRTFRPCVTRHKARNETAGRKAGSRRKANRSKAREAAQRLPDFRVRK